MLHVYRWVRRIQKRLTRVLGAKARAREVAKAARVAREVARAAGCSTSGRRSETALRSAVLLVR